MQHIRYFCRQHHAGATRISAMSVLKILSEVWIKCTHRVQSYKAVISICDVSTSTNLITYNVFSTIYAWIVTIFNCNGYNALYFQFENTFSSVNDFKITVLLTMSMQDYIFHGPNYSQLQRKSKCLLNVFAELFHNLKKKINQQIFSSLIFSQVRVEFIINWRMGF